MRKTLLPMIASLALCGASAFALFAPHASAEPARKPIMLAQMTPQAGPQGMPRRAPPPPPEDQGPNCNEITAGRADDLRGLESRLALTSAQGPLFARWRQVNLDNARRAERDCTAAQQAGGNMDLLRGLDEEERMLRQRLSDLAAERPALEAFYRSLDPRQRAAFETGGQDEQGPPPRR